MPFTEQEIDRHLETLESEFWKHRRPPLHLRDKIREGQRITGHSIELFFERPVFRRPGAWVENSIARVTYVRSRDLWKIYWKRADQRWHIYQHDPEVAQLSGALAVIHLDSQACFFG